VLLPSGNRRVTACIPHYRCRPYIARAVESLLAQTHRDLTVVVVNDGDPDPPWPELAHIDDPRLVRYSLLANRGCFFAEAVVHNATSAPYFLIQDADDWSAPYRIECLLNRLDLDRSEFAASAQPQCVAHDGRYEILNVLWRNVKPRLTATFEHICSHVGLFRTQSLREIGGYYAGFRVGYDAVLPSLMLMTGRISHVSLPLYYRLKRPESLTYSPQTGIGSSYNKTSMQHIAALYQECFGHYRRFLAGRLDSAQLKETIRRVSRRHVSAQDRSRLIRETQRLAAILRGR
jgi:glycosyltransferase involved in cell wall biosynthesis